MLQPKHTGSFDTNSFPLNVALGNIWNNSRVEEIVGRNLSVPKSEELRQAISDRYRVVRTEKQLD